MEDLNLSVIAQVLNARLINCSCDISIKGISIDSRRVKEFDLFAALKGQKVDGHDFLEMAAKNGAAAALVSRAVDYEIPQIVVEDTNSALKKLAEYYRKSFDIPVIGVTGSTGKTSTKEIISSVLSQKYKVHKTQGNFNNEIGLPLTIFGMKKENQIAVLEMGMNNLGEIEQLANIARPNIGVITNIGTAHIENLGSRDNILRAKMEITTFFDDQSILILNGDDEYLSKVHKKNYVIKRVSMYNKGDYNAVDILNTGEEGVEFKCKLRNELYKFRLNVPGIHNIYNALTSIAIGDLFNLDIKDIQQGIENYRPVGERMNIINLHQDIKIINDCYNANPDSMRAALDVLASYDRRRKIAVLGDMFELGHFSEEAHKQIGNYLKDKCDLLVAVGDAAIHIYNEAKSFVSCNYFKSKEEASSYVKSIMKDGDIILIKASNGMKMNDITNYLLEDGKKVI